MTYRLALENKALPIGPGTVEIREPEQGIQLIGWNGKLSPPRTVEFGAEGHPLLMAGLYFSLADEARDLARENGFTYTEGDVGSNSPGCRSIFLRGEHESVDLQILLDLKAGSMGVYAWGRSELTEKLFDALEKATPADPSRLHELNTYVVGTVEDIASDIVKSERELWEGGEYRFKP